jgi:cytochrome c
LKSWFIVIAALAAPAAQANMELAKQKNCIACHAPDKKLVGPSFKDIAARYAGKSDAAAALATKVQQGGVGTWGQIPMPANPKVSAEEAQRLVNWILTQK